ncbi:DVUA0089 family protein [Paracoccus sp. S3-43]|uniref:DVUA0089 family protein n=1 Tax=Paracoccus sp. S3-43 TaxID=3030011 RepID=UPI0023AF62C9|nr:DVUA0089 family protein [Paracoccus sp. S3-43]WEF25610.1 DVUA0089 family protein [Paracoccus sp. S3-43]
MPHRPCPVLAGLAAAVLCLGLPAAAQQSPDSPRICGGDPQWLGGGEGQDIAASPDPLSAQAQVAGGQALFAFRVGADSQALRVEASADDGDPAISLLTEDGDLIAENDDTPVSLNSALETTVGPGVYCVALRSVDNDAMTATVQVARPEQAPLLAEGGGDAGIDRIAACTADTPATALVPGGALDERLDQGAAIATLDGTQTGYYRFTLAQPAPVTLRAASPDLDPVLRLYDGQGGLLAENDDADGLNSRLDFAAPLAAGDYCLAVAALSAQPGELTVSAERLDVNAFLRNAYRKGELSPPADGSYPIQAVDLSQAKQTVVLHDGATQWLGFDLDQPTVVIVNAYGGLVGADPKLVLFAASGGVMAENDDADGGTDARLGPVLLEPGRYHLGVVDVGRNDGSTGPIRPIGLTFDRFLRAE